jgi:hypothetical protein
MSFREYLLSGISCCLGECHFYFSLNAYDLLMFAIGSFILISMLLFYYNRIPKSNSQKDELETPIYQSKDILLQSNNIEANYLIAEKTTSKWVKAIIYIFIAIIIFTPFYKLIGVQYSV